jgi:phytoene dehydrogenase-like protein
VQHIAKQLLGRGRDLSQKDIETSLIERFLYPKYGPVQLWEETARTVTQLGGAISTNWKVNRMEHEDGRITAIRAVHTVTGETRRFHAHFFFSTMPVKDLVEGLDPAAPVEVREYNNQDHSMLTAMVAVGNIVLRGSPAPC